MLKRYHGETSSATFAILPAIDLLGGRVVRLVEGDFDRQTVYGDDPAAVAHRFAREGADWLHVVDLDGARAGEPRNVDAVRATADRVAGGCRVEVAGGLRTEEAVARALEAGAGRAVVGTAAIRDPGFAGRLVERHGTERVVAAIDVRDGLALGEGWRPGAPGVTPESAMTALSEAGIETFEVTAVARDGLLQGPDLDLLARLCSLRAGEVIASGGIATLDDLRAARAIGCAGAIVGRALYEGRFTVAEAIAAVSA